MIAGNAGILVTRVLYVKEGEGKTFVIVDAGMNDLIRPTLYEAYHAIRPVKAAPARHDHRRRGRPGCETGDYLAFDRDIPADGRRPDRGDVGGRLWRRTVRHLQHPRRWFRKCWSRATSSRWCARASRSMS